MNLDSKLVGSACYMESRIWVEEETVPDPTEVTGGQPGTTATTQSTTESQTQQPAAEPKKKLPPRPADYDYYWYEDDDGNWRNEYDDEGYEFDPEVYEGQEEGGLHEEEDFYTEEELQRADDELRRASREEQADKEKHGSEYIGERRSSPDLIVVY